MLTLEDCQKCKVTGCNVRFLRIIENGKKSSFMEFRKPAQEMLLLLPSFQSCLAESINVQIPFVPVLEPGRFLMLLQGKLGI